jgi:RNA polymerase sigma factor (sigma-70 family)
MQTFALKQPSGVRSMESYASTTTRWARVAQLHGDVHTDLLRFLVTRMPGQDADDVAQECYLRIHRCQHLLTLENPRAFLFRVATNLLTDRARQQMRRDRWQLLMGSPICVDDAHDAPSPLPALEDSILAAEELERAAAVIASLPPKCRRAFLLQRLDGLSHEQIASALRVSKSMVEKYIAKAVGVLRNGLA